MRSDPFTAGVKECWLVLGPEKQIEVHRQPQGELFADHASRSRGRTGATVFRAMSWLARTRLFPVLRGVSRPASRAQAARNPLRRFPTQEVRFLSAALTSERLCDQGAVRFTKEIQLGFLAAQKRA